MLNTRVSGASNNRCAGRGKRANDRASGTGDGRRPTEGPRALSVQTHAKQPTTNAVVVPEGRPQTLSTASWLCAHSQATCMHQIGKSNGRLSADIQPSRTTRRMPLPTTTTTRTTSWTMRNPLKNTRKPSKSSRKTMQA